MLLPAIVAYTSNIIWPNLVYSAWLFLLSSLCVKGFGCLGLIKVNFQTEVSENPPQGDNFVGTL